MSVLDQKSSGVKLQHSPYYLTNPTETLFYGKWLFQPSVGHLKKNSERHVMQISRILSIAITILSTISILQGIQSLSSVGATGNNDMLQSLTFKVEETWSRHSLASEVPEIIGSPFGSQCDFEFHKKHVAPLYKTKSRNEFIEKAKALRSTLDERAANGTVDGLCFIFQPSQSIQFFNKCYNNGTCGCNDEEPFIASLNAPAVECRMMGSSVGSTCDYERAKMYQDKVFVPFHKTFAEAVEPHEYSNAMDVYLRDLSEFVASNYMPGDTRSICFVMKPLVNMECKPNGKCACLEASPYFVYTERQSQCVAKDDSVCLLVASTVTAREAMTTPVTIREALCQFQGATRLQCVTKVKLPGKGEQFKVCRASWLFIDFRIILIHIVALLVHIVIHT